MEKLKKVSRAQWCLFALFIGFAFLMQNCQDDDALIYEENQTETELNARPVSGKVDVCRYNARKGTYSVVSLIAKFVPSKLLPGDVYYGQDGDGDGYYRMSGCPELGNPSGEGYWDCDDTNSAITTTTNFYRDADNDTFGNPFDSFPACDMPEGYVANSLDCDDTDSAITFAANFYRDADNDTFGDPYDSYEACIAPEGYVADNTDCDDNNIAINPGEEEICGDGIDNNCNGEIDEECKTYVPDDNFEKTLIRKGLDNELDDYVDTAMINTVTYLDLNWNNISNLTGIEDFTELQILECGGNNLTSLDLSKNTKLVELQCNASGLTSLNVSNNFALEKLYCYTNQITSLDLSNNIYLTHLSISENPLGEINLSKNKALTELSCHDNQLANLNISANSDLELLICANNLITSLDLSNNYALITLYCKYNSALSCIQVNSTQLASIPATWSKDATTGYSLDCGY